MHSDARVQLNDVTYTYEELLAKHGVYYNLYDLAERLR